MATFAVVAWMFWGAVSASILAIRTAAVTTSTAAMNQAAQHAPHVASTFVGDASTLFLVIFGGVLCGCVASLLGGSLGGVGRLPTRFIGISQAAASAKPRTASA